jgi:hypothetical protein
MIIPNTAPDHRTTHRLPGHQMANRVRIDHKRATISVARKIARRSHHILRELGDQAYAAA